MSAHTPGPHHVGEGGAIYATIDGIDRRLGSARADAAGARPTREERLANATLWAAAPDLLDGLKAVLDFEAGRIPLTALVEIAKRNAEKATGRKP